MWMEEADAVEIARSSQWFAGVRDAASLELLEQESSVPGGTLSADRGRRPREHSISARYGQATTMSEQFPAGDGGVAQAPGAAFEAACRVARGPKRRALALVVGLLLTSVFELGSALVITTELLPARVPSCSMTASAAGFWGDLSETFGAWHPPNTRYLHQKACFSVFYESNAHGARDVARRRERRTPVVVLGDSFMVWRRRGRGSRTCSRALRAYLTELRHERERRVDARSRSTARSCLALRMTRWSPRSSPERL